MRIELIVASVALVLLQGCASVGHSPAPAGDEGLGETSQDKASAEKPYWADASWSTSEGEFLGMGEAEFEAKARSAAKRDALSQFAQQLGAEVVSGSRIQTESRYSESTVENASIERTSFTGIDAKGFVQDAQTQVHVERRGEAHYVAYARLAVPANVLREASEAIERQHEAKLERQAEALEILRKQQMSRAQGHEPDIAFGKAQGRASASIRRSGSRHEALHEAVEKARHRAEIKLGRQINGQRQNVSSAEGKEARYTTSSSVSSGHFSSEILAERSWELDGKIHATVTLVGWSKNSGEES